MAALASVAGAILVLQILPPWIGIATFILVIITTAIVIYRLYLNERERWKVKKATFIPQMTIDPVVENKERAIYETDLPSFSRELVYFGAKNRSGIIFKNCRVWVYFPQGFRVIANLTEEIGDQERENPSMISLGRLHSTREIILNPRKPPDYDNIAFGDGKTPILHRRNTVYYDAVRHSTTILDGDTLVLPIWLETPSKKGNYQVRMAVKPENIGRELEGTLTIRIV